MLALYRSGRQADALAAPTSRPAATLVDQLGIEPGPARKELERAILAQDPSLQAPRRPVRPAGPAAKRPRRGGLLIAAGGALLAFAIAAVALILAGSSSDQVRVAANALAVIDPRHNRVVGAVPVGTRPGAISYHAGSLWVANQDDQTVSRVDPRTLRTLLAIPVGDPPTGIAASADRVWVATSDLNPFSTAASVGRIDPQFNQLEPVVGIGNVIQGPEALAAQGDQVWAAPSTGLLTRLDATTGRVATARPRR